jgi:tetratricopeptide (TPR) repeat protein
MTTLKEKYPDDPRILATQAKLLVAQDKTDEAIEILTESFRRFPNYIGLLGHLVGLLSDKGRFEQAEQIAKSALEGAKTPLDKRELGLMLADLYAAAKKPDKRFSILDSLSQQFQDDVPLMCKLLSCQEVARDSARAQKIIDKIKAVAGENNWQWRYEQARLWYAQKDFDAHYPKIISLLGENLLSNPDDQASRLLLAEAHNRAGKNRLAISAYEEALNRSPRDARIIARLAGALYGANEFERAETLLQQAAKNGVENPDLKRLELQDYLRRGQLNSASDVLGNLLEEDPNNDQIGLSLALLKMRQGDFLGAKTLLDGIAGRDSNSIAVTAALIELKVRQGMGEEALQLCKKLIQENPNALTYILCGRVQAALGDKQSALDDFKKAVEMEPNNIDAWLAKIDFVASMGLMEDAITDVEKALDLDPNNLMVQKRAVALLLSSNKADLQKRGQSMLNSAIEANPGNADFLLQKARLLLATNTAPAIQQATDILKIITETNPTYGDAWTLLARTQLGLGQTSKAVDIALRGLVYRPNDKSLMLVKANAEAIRSPSLAIPTLKAVLEHEPNDIRVVTLLAEIYLKTGEYDKGIQLLESQLLSSQRAEDWYDLNLALSVALYKSGKVSEANQVINTLYESAPEDPRPLLAELGLLRDDGLWDKLTQKAFTWCAAHPNNTAATVRIADVLASAKNDQANKTAEDLYRQAIERDSNFSEGYLKLGTLLQMKGRPAEAAKMYQRLLEISPEHTIAINNLAWILCEEQKQYNEALTLAERGLILQPDYVDLIDTRGMAYYRLGRMDKAVEDFRRCVLLYSEQTPALVNSYFHLGRALVQLGQKSEARGQLSKALELNVEIKALSPEDSAEANRLIELLSKGGS